MENSILISPPVPLIIVCLAVIFLAYLFSKCAFKNKKQSQEATKGYSCGEKFSDHLIQPDYSQFFPFAFFFTILHVVALTIATVPIEGIETLAIAIVYVIGAVIGLFILLRR